MKTALTAKDAVEIAYEIGRDLHRIGAAKSLEAKNLQRWLTTKLDGPELASWRTGFRAGYRGLPKPL